MPFEEGLLLCRSSGSGPARNVVRRFLTDPFVHSVDPSADTVTTMEHRVPHVAGARREMALPISHAGITGHGLEPDGVSLGAAAGPMVWRPVVHGVS
ncbi:hypothetical protein [Streptomyces sp. SPB162]|uniref:hypothetical protein n=1 Tax=Streptomyces sp. SPB162 TaxID=2940560 RepID=UPI002406A481|nr:hypothetical protein [Streptomyces sp. SPB162]MDF9816515.1 hypothetical protein [Streptomyces sp. SPB162]